MKSIHGILVLCATSGMFILYPTRQAAVQNQTMQVEDQHLKDDLQSAVQKTYGEEAPAKIVIMEKTGDSATGVVVKEAEDELFLDTRPCNGQILPFKKPYSKIKAGSIRCGDKQLDQWRVIQGKDNL